MATWVRSFSADLTGIADTPLSGPADLDTDTIPGDFDAAGVTAVQFEFTLSHTGTFNTGTGADAYALQTVELEDTTDNTLLATVPATGTITEGTATVVIDLPDNSPNTGASAADWAGAQFNGVTAAAVTDFSQGKSPDGVVPQILAASVTITITYTPASGDTTVTPDAHTATTVFTGPTVSGAATVEPAAITPTTVMTGPSVSGGAIIEPAALTPTTVLTVPAVSVGITIAPAAIIATTTLTTPTVTTGAASSALLAFFGSQI